MSKGAYVGINGTAHKAKDIYIGVNGVARKVIKGYVGVNGIAQQFWPSNTVSSWDYWTASDEFELIDGRGLCLYKDYNKIAYYSATKLSGNSYIIMFMSPDQDAVKYHIYNESTGRSKYYAYNGTITDANGITWYYNSGGRLTYDAPSEFNQDIPNIGMQAQDLLDRIYTVPIQPELQHTYSGFTDVDLNVTDVRKTIRKGIGLMLSFSVQRYEPFYIQYLGYIKHPYRVLSDNADSIIDEIVNRVGNADYVNFGMYVFNPASVTTYRFPISYGNLINKPATFRIDNFDPKPRTNNNGIARGCHRYTDGTIFEDGGKTFELYMRYGSSYDPNNIPEATYSFGAINNADYYGLTFGSLGFNNVQLGGAEDDGIERGFSNVGLIL